MDKEFITTEATVCNKLGLHARAAARLVNTAAKFKSDILIGQDEANLADAKSILAVMLLAARCGTKLILKANGQDAELALKAITKLINNKFDEGQ